MVMRDRLLRDPSVLEKNYSGFLERIEIHRTKVSSGKFDSLAHSPGYAEICLNAWVNRYSAGLGLDELEMQLSDIPDLFTKTQDRFFVPAENGSPLRDLIEVASLVALFEHREGAECLAQVVEAKGVTDFFVDSFIGSVIPFRAPSDEIQMDLIAQAMGVKKRRLYTGLREAADLALDGEQVLAAQRLKKYVSGEWFRSHRAAFGWSTTNPHGYDGHWCFEGAAVAKVFGINDAALQGHKYYPDDLVTR